MISSIKKSTRTKGGVETQNYTKIVRILGGKPPYFAALHPVRDEGTFTIHDQMNQLCGGFVASQRWSVYVRYMGIISYFGKKSIRFSNIRP